MKSPTGNCLNWLLLNVSDQLLEIRGHGSECITFCAFSFYGSFCVPSSLCNVSKYWINFSVWKICFTMCLCLVILQLLEVEVWGLGRIIQTSFILLLCLLHVLSCINRGWDNQMAEGAVSNLRGVSVKYQCSHRKELISRTFSILRSYWQARKKQKQKYW